MGRGDIRYIDLLVILVLVLLARFCFGGQPQNTFAAAPKTYARYVPPASTTKTGHRGSLPQNSFLTENWTDAEGWTYDPERGNWWRPVQSYTPTPASYMDVPPIFGPGPTFLPGRAAGTACGPKG